jgi:hypothetical protein
MEIYNNFILKNAVNPGNMPDINAYMNNNLPMFIVVAVVFILFTILISIFLYSFPVLYLKLYQENNGNKFGSKEIINEFKSNFVKILIYFILMFFTMIVVFIIAFIPLIISIITLLGPFVIIAAIYLFNILSLYIYLNNKEIGFMDAIYISFNNIKKNFWPTVCSVAIVYFLVSVISGIFSFIVTFSTMMENITTIQNANYEEEEFGIKQLFMAIFKTLSYVIQYTLLNLPMITGGLVYYSMQDHKENFTTKSEIDLIGTKDID